MGLSDEAGQPSAEPLTKLPVEGIITDDSARAVPVVAVPYPYK